MSSKIEKVQQLSTTPILTKTDTKVVKEKDIIKVLNYFRYKTETTLGCALDTGILRNSITYYVVDLEKADLLQVVYIRPDSRTHYLAKYYSADPLQWRRRPQQRTLFDDWEEER